MDIENIRLTNAAGWIKGDGYSFRKLLRSAVTGIRFGSITVEYREGNSGANFIVLEDGTSVNSLGLNNLGIERYDRFLSPLVEAAHAVEKLFILSIAPLSLEDIPKLIAFAKRHGVYVVELNLGCPNIHDFSEHKPIFAYDFDLTKQAVALARNDWQGPLAVKLSPYEEETFASSMADQMNELLAPGDIVALSNTYPDFCPLDEIGKPLLKARTADGTLVTSGGMAGTRLRPLVRRNVSWFHRTLRPEIGIDAVGGIQHGGHLKEFKEDGANGFQVGTAYFNSDDPGIFSILLQQFAELVERID